MAKKKVEIISKEILGEGVLIGDNLPEALDYVFKKNLTYVVISRDKGYSLTNVDFLQLIPGVETLTIQNWGHIDLKGIHYLGNLKRLFLNIIGGTNQEIDFSVFTNLEEVYFTWMSKSKSILNCPNLKILNFAKYPKSDLSEFKNMLGLKSLVVASSPIKSLNGLENTKLEYLGLSYLTKLESLNGTEKIANTLKNLDISSCKKINKINEVSPLRNLEKLSLINCGYIDSINPIRALKKLEDFYFYDDTNIIDGDMSPCIGLKKAVFENRKHYSHTYEEINKINQK